MDNNDITYAGLLFILIGFSQILFVIGDDKARILAISGALIVFGLFMVDFKSIYRKMRGVVR